MKPQDCIEQLVGKTDEWENMNELCSVYTKPEKFPENQVIVDFETGLLTLEDPDTGEIIKSFAIKCELVELE